MGYGTRNNGQIQTFWPDDTDTELYIEADYSSVPLTELLGKAREKWPEVNLENLEISPEYIHTDCVGYGLYDSTDYTRFLKLTKVS